jgi:hypothetical protein
MGAWSMPIKSLTGIILDTLGTYLATPAPPTVEEKTGVALLATAAALVLARAEYPLANMKLSGSSLNMPNSNLKTRRQPDEMFQSKGAR